MNPFFVETLLAPFGGMSDEEILEARNHVNPNDPTSVRKLIAAVLKPAFDCYDENSQRLLRQNLSYFLTVGIDYWERLYDMSMPPIDAPDDPRQFFIWLWEVLMPDQSYTMSDVSDIEVVKDLKALGELRARKESIPGIESKQ